jgi:hypothetical protein
LFENGQIALSVGVAGKPVLPVGADEDADYRRQGLRRYWKAHNDAGSQSPSPLAPTNADSSVLPLSEPESALSARTRRVADTDADSLAGTDQVSLEEVGEDEELAAKDSEAPE